MVRTGYIICYIILFTSIVNAQSLHFSQFNSAPLLTNPANTGFIPDADYRVSAIYRNQYSAILSVPYQTFALFGDVQALNNQQGNGWLGLGLSLFRDQAGSGSLATTKAYGSVAYHQILGEASLLSAGITAGWINKRIDLSKLTFPDQFDGKFFDSKQPTGVMFDNNQINYMDIQLGINYAYFPNEKTYINGGFSVLHINRPKETFFQTTPLDPATGEPYDQRIPIQYNVFLNGSFKTNEVWIVNPNIHYSNIAGTQALDLGCTAQYNLSGDGSKQIMGGLYYRVNDAVIPMIGLSIQDFAFTFSYDATVSKLTKFNKTVGAFEFSLVKQGLFNSYNDNSRKKVICPKF